MSVHITSDVWKHSQADGVALLVLLSLADQANDEGECWPTMAKIADRCRISRRSVLRHLDRLSELGEVHWETGREDGAANVYTITVGPAADGEVRQPDTGGVRQSVTPPRANLSQGVRQSSVTPGTPLLSHRNVSESSVNITSELRSDADAICGHLAARIEKNTGTKKIITERWRTDARLLLDRDKRPPDEVHQLIDWCQDSTFWRANILSMSKFREKYDTLKLQSQRREPAHSNGFAQHGWLG